MNTRIVNVQEENGQELDEAFAQAAKIIREGGLVAFPTETVYGLGANGLDGEASARIYAAKGRPSDNPLILHICHMDQLDQVAARIPEGARRLADRCWPGPLTMIFPKKDIVPLGTTGGLDTVAVRMPDHPVALRLIKEAGLPIAAPSANLSGRPSPTTAWHTAQDMEGRIPMILDGGPCRIGIESTIVDFTEDVPVVLRPGFISLAALQEILGEVAEDKALHAEPEEDVRPKAPGQKYRHYAPKAPMTLVAGEACKVADRICQLAQADLAAGKKVGILCVLESEAGYGAIPDQDGLNVKVVGSREDLETVAHNLFDYLRRFDEEGVDVIYAEAFAGDALGFALMNRMNKAAGHHVIEV